LEEEESFRNKKLRRNRRKKEEEKGEKVGREGDFQRQNKWEEKEKLQFSLQF
jgi:hypothetical protein